MGYKGKLLTPLLAANVALAAYLILGWGPDAGADADEITSELLPPLLLWFVVSVAISWASFAYIGHRVHTLAQRAQAIAQGEAAVEPAASGNDDFAHCAARLEQLHVLLRQKEAALQRESNLLRQSEQNLRESEERYVIAIRNANDGAVEWDLLDQRVTYSPRWQAMLGLDGADIGDSVDEWYSRIHVDDYERTRTAVQQLLEGKSALFDNEHRIRHDSGDYIWVAARGVVVCSASGRPVKFIGTLTDITDKKLVQHLLSEMEQGLETVAGAAFFQRLVQNMARALDARYSFITECLEGPDGKPDRVRTIAFWADGGFADNIEYELEGTPCQEVIAEGTSSLYPMGLAQRFPKEAGMESYVGIAVLGENGRVVGHLACLDSAPMRNNIPVQSMQKLFAMRASAEIVRMSLEKSLRLQQCVTRALCDNVDNLVLLADGDGRLEGASRPLESLSGFGVAEMAGRPLDELVVPASAGAGYGGVWRDWLAQSEEQAARRYCLLGRNGRLHEIEAKISGVYGHDRRLEKIVLVGRAV